MHSFFSKKGKKDISYIKPTFNYSSGEYTNTDDKAYIEEYDSDDSCIDEAILRLEKQIDAHENYLLEKRCEIDRDAKQILENKQEREYRKTVLEELWRQEKYIYKIKYVCCIVTFVVVGGLAGFFLGGPALAIILGLAGFLFARCKKEDYINERYGFQEENDVFHRPLLRNHCF